MALLPYGLARPLLFGMDPETAHELTLDMLARGQGTPLQCAWAAQRVSDPVTLAGLRFPNRVGLAAGLDKNARCIDAFAAMGFGFVEVGTVTPLAQPGNPKPRMFRLPKANALINRLGFNNDGLDAFVANVQRSALRRQKNPALPLGLNIGKNAATPIEKATDDYLICLDGVYPHADYVTVNISSPNTKDLRELQSEAALDALLSALKSRQGELAAEHGRQVPLFLKIAPDLDESQVQAIADALREYDVCGRWGGEEFLILMPETPMDFALQIAQRVAQSIKNIRLEFLDSAISASFGLSVYRLGEAFSETLNRADAALLRAKALGRDRIESAA